MPSPLKGEEEEEEEEEEEKEEVQPCGLCTYWSMVKLPVASPLK